MTPTERLQRETAAAQALLYALRDEVEDDEQLAIDMVEGSTNLLEAIAAAVERISTVDTMVAAIKDHVAQVQDRRQRLEAQKDKLRVHLKTALEAIGTRKMELPIATLTIKASPPSVEIVDSASLPAQYLVPQPPVPDKRGILAAIKAGTTVNGAQLKPKTETISISTR